MIPKTPRFDVKILFSFLVPSAKETNLTNNSFYNAVTKYSREINALHNNELYIATVSIKHEDVGYRDFIFLLSLARYNSIFGKWVVINYAYLNVISTHITGYYTSPIDSVTPCTDLEFKIDVFYISRN